MPKTYDGFNSFPPDKGVKCTEPGARQSEKESCDINTIVSTFDRGGLVPQQNIAGLYADVSQMTDYRAAMDAVLRADAVFMALPVKVRSRFNNDPAEFLDFCSDSKNLEEMVTLGLVVPPPEAAGSAGTAGAKPPA